MNVHEKLKPIKCSHCESAFLLKSNLMVHLRKFHEKMKACPHCETFFVQKMLKDHILEVHDKSRFKCTFCKASYAEKRELRAHVKAVHLSPKVNN